MIKELEERNKMVRDNILKAFGSQDFDNDSDTDSFENENIKNK